MTSPCILIIEDHPMMVNALSISLQHILPGALCLHANSQAQGLALLAQHPELALVLLDLNLPDSQGIETLHVFCQARPLGAMMVFSMVDDHDIESVCLANHVLYVHKSQPVSLLVEAALHALALPPPPTGHHASTALSAREAEPQPLYLLSDRQLRVLSELARGKTSREIAQQLGIEESTVRTHLNVIYQRLDVKNKTQASSMYWRWSHTLGMPND
jgi:DNA-binding NarL/FixJ family response regulator